MPHTRVSHETLQNTSQSLEVADILARQHKAKNLVQTQHKGKTGSQPESTISKPPSSGKSSCEEAAPPDPATLSQRVSPMPSQVSQHTMHSRSTLPTPSTTQQLDAPCSKRTSTKRHKKHPIRSDSEGSSSDVPPCAQRKKQSKHSSIRALYQEILQAI